MKKSIIIDPPIVEGRRIISKITVPRSIRKYFGSDLFKVSLDDVDGNQIKMLSPGILNIPVISNVLYIAMLTKTDIIVNEIDRTFLHSIQEIMPIMKKFYPIFSSCRIHYEKISQNVSNHDRIALLFGGGIDSLASYMKNRNSKPSFIHINIRENFDKNELINYQSCLSDFSKKEDINIYYIATNVGEFLNRPMLSSIMMLRYKVNWWSGVAHSLGLLGICAPISILQGFSKILLGSTSLSNSYYYPWGSTPYIDNKIRWANVRCEYDIYISRQNKIEKYLKSPLTRENLPIRILSCVDSDIRYTNCNQCEKCVRTIAGLVLAGIDPNHYGFKVSRYTFDRLQNFLINKKIRFTNIQLYFWKDIQDCSITKKISNFLCNSSDFFRWLSEFDLSNLSHNRLYYISYFLKSYVFASLPKKVQKIVSKNFSK